MGEGERYEEFAPPPSLRPFIRVLWTYAAPKPTGGVQRIAPDGCPELVIDLADPYEEEGDDGVFRPQPPVILAGQMTRPMAIRPVGPVEIVAARFEPDGARDFLGLPLIDATDRRLDLVERLSGFSAPSGDPAGQAVGGGNGKLESVAHARADRGFAPRMQRRLTPPPREAVSPGPAGWRGSPAR